MNLPWGHVRSPKKFWPIGSAVLTFIGHKQTGKHPDKKAKFIYFIYILDPQSLTILYLFGCKNIRNVTHLLIKFTQSAPRALAAVYHPLFILNYLNSILRFEVSLA